MTDQLVLEVIDGPMDGLNCLIDKTGKIGRSVGSVLSLALDLEVSGRHAELCVEGPSWVLRDLKSTNGTWFKGQKLEPETSYPLKFDDIFLIGSTLIQTFQGSILDVIGSISDSDFKDPRQEYSLSTDMVSLWDSQYAAVSPEGSFCDVSTMFLSLARQIDPDAEKKYESVKHIVSNARYKLLDSWLGKVTFTPHLHMLPDTLIIAPRVWRVMDIASKKTNDPLQATDILKAIMQEGRSIVSLYLGNDPQILRDFGVISGTTVDKIANGAVPSSPIPPGKSKDLYTPPSIAHQDTGIETGAYKDFVQKIEQILKGFIEDAVNPVSGTKEVTFPGLEKEFSQLANDKEISDYLDTLYHLLVLVLASQREGYSLYGKALCSRINKNMSSSADSSSNLLSLGKKSPSSQDIANTLRATLTKAESEGVSEQVVRKTIKNKIEKYFSNSKHH